MAGEIAPGVSTNFGGISINGAVLSAVTPFQNVRGGLPCGLTLYVSSNGGLDRNGSVSGGFGDGTNINAPLATLAAAMSALNNRTNRGDVIYVLPGHTESISTADYFSNTGTASRCAVIGLGAGDGRPTFTWTTATSTWLMDTAGVEIANCNLYLAGASATGALTVAAAITVSAADCRFVGNYIHTGWDSDSIVALGISATDAADGLVMIGNEVIGVSTAVPTTAPIQIAGADRAKILGNRISAPSASGIGVIKLVATAATQIQIIGNDLQNNAASSTVVVTTVASGTGTIASNFCRNMTDANVGHLPATGNYQFFANYGVNNNAEVGILIGTPSV